MDCAHCEPVLLDLCYGELTPPAEREARTHISSCPTCRKVLARLESGQALAQNLPQEAPSAESTTRIMQLARAHGRRSSRSLIGRSWLSSLARVAMTRQVAMATLSLLIVFVGLWSMPELTRRRDAGELSPEVEGAEAARAGQATSSQPTAAEPSGPGRPRGGPSHADGRATPRKHDAPAAREGIVRARARPEPGAQNARAEAKPRERPEPPRFAPAPPASAAAAQAAPLAETAVQAALDEQRALSGSEGDDALAFTAPAPATASAAAPAEASGSSAASLEAIFKAGLERYRSGDYAAAVQLLSRMLESSAPSGQRAPALLYLARSERALGRCDRAIRAYETLVRSYGSSQQSLAAMLEGVECYDRVGEPMAAQRLLEHATSVPSLAAQATRALQERGVSSPRGEALGDKQAAPQPR